MSRRRRRKAKKQRALKRQRAQEDRWERQQEEASEPASAELKRRLFDVNKFLHGGFLLAFALGYLGPVALDERFHSRWLAAVQGTALGLVGAGVVFVIHQMVLLRERAVAREALRTMAAGNLNRRTATIAGLAAGLISGLYYPVCGYVRPVMTAGPSDSSLGGFLFGPLGAVYTVFITAGWCYMRESTVGKEPPHLQRSRHWSWFWGVVVAMGFWLFFASFGVFPRGRHGIPTDAPFAWMSMLPLFVIMIGFAGFALVATKNQRLKQNVADQHIDDPTQLSTPVPLSGSQRPTKQLVQSGPQQIQVRPTIYGVMPGCGFLLAPMIVGTLLVCIWLWAPHLSEGSGYVVMLMAPFTCLGVGFLTVPRRWTFDNANQIVTYGNIWGRQVRQLSDITAVQVMNGNGWQFTRTRKSGPVCTESGPTWQLNLVLSDPGQRRLNIWDHGDQCATDQAAKNLAEFLDVPLHRT